MNEFQRKIEESWDQYRKEKSNQLYPNVMLLGISGAGKSSLVNRIFGVDLAKVSHVRPETQGFSTIYYGKKYGTSVNIIDTAGYEMDQAESYYKKVHRCMMDGVNGQTVHIAWYCIPIVNERIEKMDISILEKLMQEESIRKRLCVVFTKCDEDDEDGSTAQAYREILEQQFNYQISTFETSYLPDCPLELDQLIAWSANAIDEEDLRRQFVASQFIDLDSKRKAAISAIAIAATASAAAGAIPLPFADSIVLVPIQLKMIQTIIDSYGVTNLASLSAGVVGDVVISQLGKSAARSLVSLIPGAGTILNIATAAINASVASLITSSLGFAISEICYQNVKKYLKGETVVWDKIFDENTIKQLMQQYKNSHKDELKDE